MILENGSQSVCISSSSHSLFNHCQNITQISPKYCPNVFQMISKMSIYCTIVDLWIAQYCLNITKIFLKYFTNISKFCPNFIEVLSKYCLNIVKMFSNIVEISSKYFLKYCLSIVQKMSKYYTKINPKYLPNIVKILFQYHRRIVQKLSKCCQNIVYI